MGKCSIYTDEYRAPKKCATSEIFNLLNDLNNISINNEKLSSDQKINLIKVALTGNKCVSKIRNEIFKEFNIDKSDEHQINGERIDASGQPLYTPLESIYMINKILGYKDLINLFIDDKTFRFNKDNIFDKIAKILHSTQIIEKRLEKLEKIKDLSKKQIEKLAKEMTGFSQTHSLSFKAMHELIDIMIVENKNQMQIIFDKGIMGEKIELSKSKYLGKD
ncbi:MAG: hypothetical protein DSZ21_01780 [Tenericutes bacterium]|nr:MAG: hypothetical protein DSZ21_01780 [Mycoplasmatota bacterium]